MYIICYNIYYIVLYRAKYVETSGFFSIKYYGINGYQSKYNWWKRVPSVMCEVEVDDSSRSPYFNELNLIIHFSIGLSVHTYGECILTLDLWVVFVFKYLLFT
jgi:hypothetical protein